MPGIEGVLFEADQLTALFSKSDTEPPRVLQVEPGQVGSRKLYDLPEENKGPLIKVDPAMFYALKAVVKNPRQEGRLLLSVVPKDKSSGGGVELAVNDILTNKELWRKLFKNTLPGMYFSGVTGTVAAVVPSRYADLRENPQLKSRIASLSGKAEEKNGYVIETFDALSGSSLGVILVDTNSGSFKVREVTTTRELVLVHDSKDRTLIYSLKTGLQTGRVFGKVIALSKSGDRMLLEKGPGEAELLDVNTLQTLARYTFASPVILSAFSEDGGTLNALTAEQAVYQISLDQQKASMGN
jgi:hypothetical protein